MLSLPGQEMAAASRRSLVAFTILVGIGLIFWGLLHGIGGPDRPLGGASASWVVGALVLVAVPALLCLVRPKLPQQQERA